MSELDKEKDINALTVRALQLIRKHFPSVLCWWGSGCRREAPQTHRCDCPAASETSFLLPPPLLPRKQHTDSETNLRSKLTSTKLVFFNLHVNVTSDLSNLPSYN